MTTHKKEENEKKSESCLGHISDAYELFAVQKKHFPSKPLTWFEFKAVLTVQSFTKTQNLRKSFVLSSLYVRFLMQDF